MASSQEQPSSTSMLTSTEIKKDELLLNKIAKLLLGKCDFENVPTQSFANVEIVNCNAIANASFSKATFVFKIESAVPLIFFWKDAVSRLIRGKVLEKESRQLTPPEEESFRILLDFLSDDDNKRKLAKAKTLKTEAGVQSVLAHHFFSKLTPSGKYWIGGSRKCASECPACGSPVNVGDTSFGHVDYWHGFADILIDKSVVKVKTDESKDDDEDDEPAVKVMKLAHKRRHEYHSDASQPYDEVHFLAEEDSDDCLEQIFSQTIVNAFYETNINQGLANVFVPSFLVTANTVSIHMYSCGKDRLYTSKVMDLWNENELNFATVISVWLAINFQTFQNEVPEEEFTLRHYPRSNFRKIVEEKLEIYKSALSKPLKDAWKRHNIISNNIFSDQRFWIYSSSRYREKISEELNELSSLFLKEHPETEESILEGHSNLGESE